MAAPCPSAQHLGHATHPEQPGPDPALPTLPDTRVTTHCSELHRVTIVPEGTHETQPCPGPEDATTALPSTGAAAQPRPALELSPAAWEAQPSLGPQGPQPHSRGR